MSDFLIPVETINVVGSRCSTAQSGRSRHIVEVCHVELSLRPASCNKILVFWIELESFDSSAVLLCARYKA